MMHREIARYGVKGAAFVLINVAVQMVLVELGGLHPATAAALSTATLPLLGYVAMNRFVFPDARASSRRAHLKRFGQYVGVNYSSKLVNYVLFLALLWIGVWYPAAYIIGAGVVFIGSFSLNRWLWHGEVLA